VHAAHPDASYVNTTLTTLAEACRELGIPEASPLDELREVVRHEAAHLAFARTHAADESAGHSGPSEDFALAFEKGR
jgi:hypothetical protein